MQLCSVENEINKESAVKTRDGTKCARSARIIYSYHDPLLSNGGLKLISNSYKK